MKVMWAPWRMDYILGPKPDHCVLCIPPTALEDQEAEKQTEDDNQRLVLYRGKLVYVIMNRYPYNTCHLMVAPYRHVGDLTELTTEECAETMFLVQQSLTILREHCQPQGVNVGANLGAAAGAGIREHLHIHLVPRWNGDSSFMAVLDDVRVVPEHLHATFTKLKPLFDRLSLKSSSTD